MKLSSKAHLRRAVLCETRHGSTQFWMVLYEREFKGIQLGCELICYPFFTFSYKTAIYSIWRSYSPSRSSLFSGYLMCLSRNIGQMTAQDRRLPLFALPHSQSQSSPSAHRSSLSLQAGKWPHISCVRDLL